LVVYYTISEIVCTTFLEKVEIVPKLNAVFKFAWQQLAPSFPMFQSTDKQAKYQQMENFIKLAFENLYNLS
jgi:hypothetical protein